jgi:hypothetical protein
MRLLSKDADERTATLLRLPQGGGAGSGGAGGDEAGEGTDAHASAVNLIESAGASPERSLLTS